MLSDDFLYSRLRELTIQYVTKNPKPIHMYFGEADTDSSEYHEFELEVLCTENDDEGPYIQVLTAIMCLRGKGEIGSPYSPLCCISIVRPSGIDYGPMGNLGVSDESVPF
jgi:hypothetical protein